MSFEMSAALAVKLLKIRESNNEKVKFAQTALVKAKEKISEIDPKILHLQQELKIVKEIPACPRQEVPGKVANLMGVKNSRIAGSQGPPPKLFK
jgi:hypothetical protein